MDGLITIDASKARRDFFKILDKVYLEEKAFLIRKAGIPVAEISKAILTPKRDIMEFAGIWKDIDAGKMIANIYEARKDKSRLKRKLPKISD